MKFFFVLFLLSSVARATDMKREVWAIWDSQEGPTDGDQTNTNLHRKLEFIFNHYGLKLRYHDISQGLPPESVQTGGVVSWFSKEGIKNPSGYEKWLSKQVEQGSKLLVLGEFGFSQNEKGGEVDIKRVNRVMSQLGLEVGERFFDNPLLFSIAHSRGADFVEFERSLENEIFSFRQTKSHDPKNEVWLSLGVRGETFGSDVIVVGPRGAYVQEGFALFNNPQNDRSHWRVNPFKLIEKVFVDPTLPVPDTTTLNGSRIYFSHIDGDGFMNVSHVDRSLYSGEIILQRILKRYPLPATASVITLEMNPALGIVKDPKAVATAKAIFALPHVEVGSHTYSHPLSWNLFPSKDEIRNYYGATSKHQGPILSYKLPGLKLDYTQETAGSIDFINSQLAPKGKRAEILLWSGSCRPPREALSALDARAFLNINGGDSRMDQDYDSFSHLSALYRQVGGHQQIYSGNANENVYTNLWTPPFAGFRDVIQTFVRTESPKRLKPVNVYYHYYSGEHPASLESLHQIFTWALKQNINPVFASDYARIVQGFTAVKIDVRGPRSFAITKNGAQRTFRFADSSLVPDYKLSKNILGHQVFQNELYVFLGTEAETLIELKEGPVSASHLISANGRASIIQRDATTTTYKLQGHLPIRAEFWEQGKRKIVASPLRELEIKVRN